jgi:hypothetical protein
MVIFHSYVSLPEGNLFLFSFMFMVGIMLNMDEYDEQKHQGGILKRSIIFVAINGGVK